MAADELERLRSTLLRAAYVAEHLMGMINRDTWRTSGGDDGQGHYEGDYRAEQLQQEIKDWVSLAERPTLWRSERAAACLPQTPSALGAGTVMLKVPTQVARAVFDIATSSMDFGSGFLDDEEVTQLRHFASIIGVNPWLATPENHRPKYCPKLPDHGPWKNFPKNPPFGPARRVPYRRCLTCGLLEHLA